MSSFLSCYGQINIFCTFPLFAGSAILSTSAMSVIKKQPSVARNLSLGSHASTTCSSFAAFCLLLGSDNTPSSFNIPSKKFLRRFWSHLFYLPQTISANDNYRKIKHFLPGINFRWSSITDSRSIFTTPVFSSDSTSSCLVEVAVDTSGSLKLSSLLWLWRASLASFSFSSSWSVHRRQNVTWPGP